MNTNCQNNGHCYSMISEEYFKYSGKEGAMVKFFDKSIKYRMFFCNRCGCTSEIISKDRRKKEKLS